MNNSKKYYEQAINDIVEKIDWLKKYYIGQSNSIGDIVDIIRDAPRLNKYDKQSIKIGEAQILCIEKIVGSLEELEDQIDRIKKEPIK